MLSFCAAATYGAPAYAVATVRQPFPPRLVSPNLAVSHMMYLIPGPVCGERTLATAQKLSERPNRAGIISICPLHNIVGV